MRYGTSTPEALVERAAQHGQPVLALTDRDGLYGAVRFVQAATAAGIAPSSGSTWRWGRTRRSGAADGLGRPMARTGRHGGRQRDRPAAA